MPASRVWPAVWASPTFQRWRDVARNQQWKGNPRSVAPKVRGEVPQRNTQDRTACSECQQVQGRHTQTCSRRPQ